MKGACLPATVALSRLPDKVGSSFRLQQVLPVAADSCLPYDDHRMSTWAAARDSEGLGSGCSS